MAHPLATHRASSNFHAALITNDSLVTDALVFAAITFPVLNRTENLFIKQTVFFRTLGAVVNSFRLGNFTVRPGQNCLRSGELDSYTFKFFSLGEHIFVLKPYFFLAFFFFNPEPEDVPSTTRSSCYPETCRLAALLPAACRFHQQLPVVLLS